jgi:hypothetical protein
MSLKKFMNDLLTTSHVDPSEVVIVEDNADASQEFTIVEDNLETSPMHAATPANRRNQRLKGIFSHLITPPLVVRADCLQPPESAVPKRVIGSPDSWKSDRRKRLLTTCPEA